MQRTTNLKVLIADKMSPVVESIFKDRGIHPLVKPGLKAAALSEALSAVDGVVIRSGAQLDQTVLNALPTDTRLKVIGRAGIGVDNIDMHTASARGIVVMNTPFGNAVTTAEHAIALLLATVRHIPAASAALHGGAWEKSAFKGIEVMGKTLGVVGAGTIGSLVVERALGLKMKVLICDPFLSLEQSERLGGEKVEWEALLSRADFITFHVPLTKSTEQLLNEAALKQCKPGVVIINCARGGIVDETALKAALTNGNVSAAALDVFSTEPLPPNHPLCHTPRLVLTPHLGAATREAQERVGVQIAEQLSDFLLSGEVRHAVNTFSLSAAERVKLMPYTRLAAHLAQFVAAMLASPVLSLKLSTTGSASTLPAMPLLATVLTNLLKKAIAKINPINAITISKQRGINSTCLQSNAPSPFHALLALDVKTEKYHYHISGTVVGTQIHIVKLQDSTIGAELGRYHLYIINKDQPGFVAALSQLLNQQNINITAFHLAAASAPHANSPQTAAALITLTTALPAALMTTIKNLPLVIKATYVELSD